MPTFTPIRRTLLVTLLLLTATVAVYWPVASAQYLSIDDHAYVSSNQIVRAGLTWNGLVWAFDGAHVANYHPITWLSHMLDCQFFGPGPRAAHLVNLALHAVNSVLLFVVLRWLTGRDWCSAIVAAVFAVHPQHVESVAWVSERKDVLSGLFWILTLAAWTWYVESPRWWKYALALLAFALGLLSKPMVVTLPCVLLLLDFWPLRRMRMLSGDPTSTYRKPLAFLLVEKIPFVVLAIAGSIATIWAQSAGGAVASMEQLPLGFRVGNALVAYALYARKFLWPSDLAAFYPLLRPWPLASVIAAVAVLLAVTAATMWKARSKPYLPIGWLWFVGTLVPVIGLVQVGNQSMADRYMYLPMIGLAIMATWLSADVLRERARRAGIAVAMLLVVCCGAVSAYDVRAWRDSETLFTRALERTEPNVFALHNLASAKLIGGDVDGAISCFERCARLQPGNPHVRRAWGFALRVAKRYDEAAKELALSVHLAPDDGRCWAEMGHLHLDRQQWPAAAACYVKAVALRPDDYDARVSLAVAHRLCGNAEAALADLRAALQINPRLARPWCAMGALLLETNRPAEAIEPLARGVAIDPTFAEGQYRLGLALMRAGRGDEALAPLMAALELDPKSPAVMTQLAWLLATHPDEKLRRGEDAVFFARTATELSASTSPDTLDALAAALAEQKQFEQATETAERAAAAARGAGDEALAKRIDERAAQYRSKLPTRDASLAGTDLREAH